MAAYTTIDDPEAYFQTKLYTGDGSTQSITLDGDTDMQPDLVWIKSRSFVEEHILYDAVRGVTKDIRSNGSAAENTNVASLTAFGSDGWTMGSFANINQNTSTFVAWNWKESATAGFDIVAHTGNGSGRTLSHSLSAVPHMYFTKEIGASGEAWNGYTKAMGAGYTTMLNLTNASQSTTSMWNNTAPTSSVFSVGADAGSNGDGKTYISYLWSEKQGFSAMGSYIGNGNADGTFVYTGFRPAFVMTKNTGAGHDWWILDNKRDVDNSTNARLVANETNAEDAAGSSHDFLSNGFKLRTSGSADVNGSGDTMIYMAFAEAPFVNSNGVPCNAR